MNYKNKKYNPTLSEITRLHGLYQCGCSFSDLVKNHNAKMTRQSIHYYFKAFGLSARKLKKLNKVEYNGFFYTCKNGGYLRKTNGDREFLHRDKWKNEKGEIPYFFDVHHIDGDKLNNDINNLELISKSEHTKKHYLESGAFSILKKCSFCGKYIAKKSNIEIKKAVCCSKECSTKYQILSNRHVSSYRKNYKDKINFLICIIASNLHNGIYEETI